MSWYDFFKFLHVAVSIAWLGGGLALIVLAMAASGKNDPAEIINSTKRASYVAGRLFPASAVGALLTGILMALVAPVSLWGQAWFVIGLIGWASSLAVGPLMIGPRSERLMAMEATGGAAANVTTLGREMLSIMQFDIILLFTVVADMVLKPQWSDWYLVVVFLLVIAAAAWFFLSSILRAPPAARA